MECAGAWATLALHEGSSLMRASRGVVIAAVIAGLAGVVSAGAASTRPVTTSRWAIVIPRLDSEDYIVRYDLLTSTHPDSPRTLVRLKVRADPYFNSFHAWSPDGTKVAVDYPTSRKDSYHGKDSLYVASVRSGRGKVVVPTSRWGTPVWSPDSTRLAFSRSSGLYVVSLNGRPARRFSSLGAGGPISWAPDGRSVVCYCGGKLRIVAVDGSGSRPLAVHSVKVGLTAAWSPSGRYVAYEHDCGLHGLRETGDAYCTVGFANPSGARIVQPHPSICKGVSNEPLWATDDTLLVAPWGCSPGLADLYRVNPTDGTVKPVKSYVGGLFTTGPNGSFAFLAGANNKPHSTLVIVDRHDHILQRQPVPVAAYGDSSITLNA